MNSTGLTFYLRLTQNKNKQITDKKVCSMYSSVCQCKETFTAPELHAVACVKKIL